MLSGDIFRSAGIRHFRKYVISFLFVLQMKSGASFTRNSVRNRGRNDADVEKLQKQISALIGSKFVVKDRYQQHELISKLWEIRERGGVSDSYLHPDHCNFQCHWIPLTMLVIERKNTYPSCMALEQTAVICEEVFLTEGLLITGLELLQSDLLSGFIICFLQERFGIIERLGNGGSFVIDAYRFTCGIGFVYVICSTVFHRTYCSSVSSDVSSEVQMRLVGLRKNNF
ncbi:MAG: hypothetical protein IPF81_13890 [Bacteroidetes bacterium]|nr:hypothetical protein [Bacteroidota bacterium]